MNGPWGYYAKWNKSDRERWIPYDFIPIWIIKQNKTKQMKKQNKTKTNKYREQIGGYQRGSRVERGQKWVKGVNCMVMDGNQTFGGEHTVCSIYRGWIIMLYTWNLYNVLNQCYLIKKTVNNY